MKLSVQYLSQLSTKQIVILSYILFTLVIANSSTSLYAVFIFVVIYYLVEVLQKGFRLGFNWHGWDWVDIVPALFIFSWFYGVIVGLLRENNIYYVFSNFAGFICYFSYYLLIWSKTKRSEIFNVLIFSALVVCFINITIALSYVLFSVDVWNDPLVTSFLGGYVGGSSTGQIRMYSTSQIIVFPIMALAMSSFILPSGAINYEKTMLNINSRLSSLIFIMLSGVVVIIMPASKGFMLATLVIIFISIIIWQGTKNRMGGIIKLIYGTLLVASFYGLLVLTGYDNILEMIFSEKDDGNITRYIQLADLLEDISFAGQGLGAILPGNVRDEERPYGFELSYVNLIHKLGVLSILPFAGYILSLKKITSVGKIGGSNLRYAAVALGGFCFVFVGVGNPIISSPQLVLLHCMSLFLVRRTRL